MSSIDFEATAAGSENTPTLTDTVYQTLLEGIITGRIPPGTRLVHRKLAKEMGTSNNPVVAALRQLEGVGLLVNKPGEGSEVRRWDAAQYEESMRIRAALEGVAYRYFTIRATAEDFEFIQHCSDEYDEACDRGDWEACAQADRKLHLRIVRASGSAELIRLIENASLILLTARIGVLPAGLKQVGLRGDHHALIAALKSGDPDVAEEARKHLLDSRSFEEVKELAALARARGEEGRMALAQLRAVR